MTRDRPLFHLPFSEHVLDRVSERRKDAVWLKAALARPASRVVDVAGSMVAVTDTGALAWRGLREDERDALILLGLDDRGEAIFAHPEVTEPASGHLVNLRDVALSLSAHDAAAALAAVALSTWHARHPFCAACGSPTSMHEAGHTRRCESCGTDHFPRMDPAVIMLVTDGERCVLGRRQGAVAGRWSNLAGFVEPGESPESAVVREVFEEVGLKVLDVAYRGSQPWPFPSSLMLAYEALVQSGELVGNDEHQEVRWFTREEINAAIGAKTMTIPAPLSAGHFLLNGFIEGTSVFSGSSRG